MLFYIYRRLLNLYPSHFRNCFADDMLADFADAMADARQSAGWTGVAKLCALAVADLATSASRQWTRTGWLVSVGIALAWTSLSFGLLAYQFVPLQRRFYPFPQTGLGQTLVTGFLGTIGVVVTLTVLTSRIGWAVSRRRREP